MRYLLGLALLQSASLAAPGQEDPSGRKLELFDITDLLSGKIDLPASKGK